MRIQYKGGVWKNSEDEILKAAVMKYGMNQWARIASLLVRKSAKQCKARWYEWLDPSIKKTAWTREEEERLLHLAKIMPTQWRTIAPMIGRTAAQCIEHYEKLLDAAQKGSASTSGAGSGAGDGLDAARNSQPRPFETDPAPESKPARPDPVDMDEDEMEMLSEARARLANTKGKKAKRKTREKQLEAAKRLANLQKKRELKAAGIEMKPSRRNRNQPDFAIEIPFERESVPGFYDTREEDARAELERKNARNVGKLLEKYEGKRYDELEQVARKKDEERRKIFEEKNGPAATVLSQQAVPQDVPLLQRKQLNLPKPQVSDMELEAIAKAGSFFAAKARKDDVNGITDGLIPERNPVLATPSSIHGTPSAASTPNATAESWAAKRSRLVETNISLHSADTPLVGGQNTPLPDLGLSNGVTPASSVMRTPNPLATPSEASVASDFTAQFAKSQKARLADLRKNVQKRLDMLAKPANEYEFDLSSMDPHLDSDDEMEDSNANGEEAEEFLEDAEEQEKRIAKEGIARLEKVKKRALSSAARKILPHPEVAWVKNPSFPTELAPLVLRDISVLNILERGSERNSSEAEIANTIANTVNITNEEENYLKQARALVRAECQKANLPSVEDFKKALEAQEHELLSTTKAVEWYVNDSGEIEKAMTNEERVIAHERVQSFASERVKSQQKQQKKLDIFLGGFQQRMSKLSEDLEKEWRTGLELKQQLACYRALYASEKEGVPKIIADWQEAVEQQRERERQLQIRYAKLVNR